MTISEISSKLDAAVQAIESKKNKVAEANDKRAAAVADLDAICNRVAKEFSEVVAEAHKLRDELQSELSKIPSLGLNKPGVQNGNIGISK